jgi:hypothetical protein
MAACAQNLRTCVGTITADRGVRVMSAAIWSTTAFHANSTSCFLIDNSPSMTPKQKVLANIPAVHPKDR